MKPTTVNIFEALLVRLFGHNGLYVYRLLFRIVPKFVMRSLLAVLVSVWFVFFGDAVRYLAQSNLNRSPFEGHGFPVSIVYAPSVELFVATLLVNIILGGMALLSLLVLFVFIQIVLTESNRAFKRSYYRTMYEKGVLPSVPKGVDSAEHWRKVLRENFYQKAGKKNGFGDNLLTDEEVSYWRYVESAVWRNGS